MKVTPLEMRAMHLVDKRDGITVGELQDELGLTWAAAHAVAHDLVAKGQAVIHRVEIFSTWGGIVPDGLRTAW